MRSFTSATILALLLLVLGLVLAPTANAFQSAARNNVQTTQRSTITIQPLSMGFMNDVQGFFKKITYKASASHILIKGGAEAANKLEDLKVEIGDSLAAFSKAAADYSECPSSKDGGSLGSFGPGRMVKEFDTVVFNDAIGVVHGPIKTQFGYHLIYIKSRSE
jgi:peptidyl-prolyl cis-trans isomerase C